MLNIAPLCVLSNVPEFRFCAFSSLSLSFSAPFRPPSSHQTQPDTFCTQCIGLLAPRLSQLALLSTHISSSIAQQLHTLSAMVRQTCLYTDGVGVACIRKVASGIPLLQQCVGSSSSSTTNACPCRNVILSRLGEQARVCILSLYSVRSLFAPYGLCLYGKTRRWCFCVSLTPLLQWL